MEDPDFNSDKNIAPRPLEATNTSHCEEAAATKAATFDGLAKFHALQATVKCNTTTNPFAFHVRAPAAGTSSYAILSSGTPAIAAEGTGISQNNTFTPLLLTNASTANQKSSCLSTSETAEEIKSGSHALYPLRGCCDSNNNNDFNTHIHNSPSRQNSENRIISFSTPATPRIHAHTNSKVVAAAWTGAVLHSTAKASAADRRRTVVPPSLGSTPAAFVARGEGLAAGPTKRRRSIHVDGSNSSILPGGNSAVSWSSPGAQLHDRNGESIMLESFNSCRSKAKACLGEQKQVELQKGTPSLTSPGDSTSAALALSPSLFDAAPVRECQRDPRAANVVYAPLSERDRCAAVTADNSLSARSGGCAALESAKVATNNGCGSSPVLTVLEPQEEADNLAAPGKSDEMCKPLQFLDSGSYSFCYHTAMAGVPYCVLSSPSAAARVQETLMLDREREARRRRKSCLSLLRSVHRSLASSPTLQPQSLAAAAALRHPVVSSDLAVAARDSLLLPPAFGSSENHKNNSDPSFTCTDSSRMLQSQSEHQQQQQLQTLQQSLPLPPNSEAAKQWHDASAITGEKTRAGMPAWEADVDFSRSTVAADPIEGKFTAPASSSIWPSSTTPLSFSDLVASSAAPAAAAQARNTHGAPGNSLHSQNTAWGSGPVAALRSQKPQQLKMEESIEETPQQQEIQSCEMRLSGKVLRLCPQWLSPYTLATLIDACVHCYDSIRQSFPPPEPSPRLCILSLPALYTQLPPHLKESAVLLDEAASWLGEPPSCIAIECSLIESKLTAASGTALLELTTTPVPGECSLGTDLTSSGSSSVQEGIAGKRALPQQLIGEFDIIVCETRYVTLTALENVAACVKALCRRRRHRHFQGKGRCRKYSGILNSSRASCSREGECMEEGAEEYAVANDLLAGGFRSVKMEVFGEDGVQKFRKERSHGEVAAAPGIEEEKIDGSIVDSEEDENVDSAAAALVGLSLFSSKTRAENQQQHQMHSFFQQQQQPPSRLPASSRVIMLSTCLLSPVVDELLGLKQSPFQPYVPSSALSSLQLQCIYTNFSDFAPLQRHNDVDFATRVRACRRYSRDLRTRRRAAATISTSDAQRSRFSSNSTSTTHSEALSARCIRDSSGTVEEKPNLMVRDPMLHRALVLQAVEEAQAAVHVGEGAGEAALYSTNDEFSPERTDAAESKNDNNALATCRGDTNLLSKFDKLCLRQTYSASDADPDIPAGQAAAPEAPPAESLSASVWLTRQAASDDAPMTYTNAWSSAAEPAVNTDPSSHYITSVVNKVRSQPQRGITMREDDEDDGIDYNLECGSCFGMAPHDL